MLVVEQVINSHQAGDPVLGGGLNAVQILGHQRVEIDDPEVVECHRCPIGSACEESGNTLASLPLLPGYWRTSNQSSDLRRCPDASLQDKSACANMNGQPCKPWTTGPYCRVCNVTDGSRYFDSAQSACVECGDTAETSLATLIGIAVAVLLLSAAPTNGNKLLSHLGLRDQCIQGPGGSTRGTYGPFRTNFYTSRQLPDRAP